MQSLAPDAFLYPVLIFDPQIERAERLATGLGQRGLSITVAPSAQDAIAFAKRTYFRVMIIAAELNSKDCLQFLDVLRRAAPRSWLLVLWVRIDRALEDLIHRHGADALLEIKVDIDELARRITLLQVASRPLY